MKTTTLGTEWNLQIKSTGSMDKIREAIQAKKAIAVSDGSYQNDTGACAWIIEGLSLKNRIEGLMETPGSPSDHSSFRSEAVGQYGLLLNLYHLLNNHQGGGSILVACDGRLVLDQLRSKKSIDPFAAHADLFRACQTIETHLPCQVQFIHVKGHQDNGLPMVLSREVWLNTKADLTAKDRINITQSFSTKGPIPFNPWGLTINQRKIVKNHK